MVEGSLQGVRSSGRAEQLFTWQQSINELPHGWAMDDVSAS